MLAFWSLEPCYPARTIGVPRELLTEAASAGLR